MTSREHAIVTRTGSRGRSSTYRSQGSAAKRPPSSSPTSKQAKDHNCLTDSIVIDSRPVPTKGSIRRRRICSICQERFSTTEILIETALSETDQNEHKRRMQKTIAKFEAELAKLRRMVEKL